jgi:chromosome segregation protein
MKIKKLELLGFKSFVDRTVVHFDHDVLGIVGPNGCGKSNIVDAIRWSMGEMSAKHLRGKSMEDVIFNGSDSRAPSEFAEVTLTFENNDPSQIPLDYRDFPEIAVTRRLHRNGDSEYLLNRTQVRLKDITELFLGTGVGTKAYSIVEQGKIGLIVSAKPEDRRMLVEEAAGITKFKAKKKSAEKKMELTQQNLLRVSDILAEIDRNMGSLKRQAQKAERYVSYRQELEELSLYEASHRYLETTAWVKYEAGEVNALTDVAEKAKTELAAKEADLESLRLAAHAAESTLETATARHFGADNTVRAEQAAIERAADRIGSLAEREEQAGREAEDARDQAELIGSEREQLQEQLSSLEEDEANAADRLDAEDARLSELTGRLETADGQLAELRREEARLQSEVAASVAKLSTYGRRRDEAAGRRQKLLTEREGLEGQRFESGARAAQLAEELERLRSGKTTSVEERQGLEEGLVALKAESASAEKVFEQSRSEFQKKKSRLQALTELQNRLDGVGGGAKALLATKDATIVGFVADLLEAPAEHTAALAGYLGPQLSAVVVRDRDRGAALLADLQEKKKGRAIVVPETPLYAPPAPAKVPQIPGVYGRLAEIVSCKDLHRPLMEALLGDTLSVEDGATAIRAFDEGHPGPCATVHGMVYFRDGRITGGSGEDVAAGMLEMKREMRALAEETQLLEAAVTQAQTQHHELRGKVTETQVALEQARLVAHEGELALVRTEKDLRAAEGDKEKLERRLDQVLAELEDWQGKLGEVDDEQARAEEGLEAAQGLADDLARRREDAEFAAENWREQVDAQRQNVTEHKVRTAQSREKIAGARATIARLDKNAEELRQREQRLREEQRFSAMSRAETEAEKEEHRHLLLDALDAARDAEDALREAKNAYEEHRAALSAREAGLKELRQQADGARAALTQHEMKLREYMIALQHLREGVAQKFRGLRIETVVSDYHMRPPPDAETRARIAELAGLLERMGSVNLEAMKEYEEAEKRLAFYAEQKADLDAALADLEKAIQQMNRESKRLFKEAFDKINANFQVIFPKMFRGGRASLRLTTPEDMLETGIDILAQPPGKKLSSIELMSGGEKALTAVSLIFAIFLIKPSPFCILDEVDAPLDEANVARYNEMVREMTDQSQFILITHIKRTMQMVDVLYGVTMQESGVSKLVSVKMTEAGSGRKGRGILDQAVA